MPLDLPTFATYFEPSSLASLPSFRKHCPQRLYHRYDFATRYGGYWLYMIMRSIIGFTRDRGTLERLACFLFLLFLLLLLFSLTLGRRCCVMVARLSLYRAHGAVNNLLQRFDNKFKMSVYNVLLDSTDL